MRLWNIRQNLDVARSHEFRPMWPMIIGFWVSLWTNVVQLRQARQPRRHTSGFGVCPSAFENAICSEALH